MSFTTKPPKVLLFGSGSVGTIYSYLLLKAGCDVTAVCRSNYSVAVTSGFKITSGLYGADLHIQPRVVRDCTEAVAVAGDEPFDYLIVSTKAFPNSSAPSLIAPAVRANHTTIVLMQNGIDIEPEYADAFPANPLLSCVVYLPTTQVAPARVTMGSAERLEIGTYPSLHATNVRESTDRFIQILSAAGSNVHKYDDIQERRWYKMILNVSWNPLCALTLAKDTAILGASESAERVVEGVMGEVVAIASKLGYESLTIDAARTELSKATKRIGTRGIEPSMLADVLNGKRMEVDAILGNPVKVARRLGVAVPRMDLLYTLTKVLDKSLAERKSGESLSGDDLSVE